MKSPALFAACLFACLGAQAKGEETFPASELGKLPYLYFSANNLGESDLFRMRQEDCTIEAGGNRYIGFQFWSTGLVEWLFTTTSGGLEPGTWLLVNQKGEVVDNIEPTDVPLVDCPRISARYPLASRVTRYKTGGEGLETRGRYHLLQKVDQGKPAPYAICLTSCSPDSYEAGRSGDLIRKIDKPLLRDSSDVVIANTKDLRRDEGVQAATAYLAREIELRMDDSENASSFPDIHSSEANQGFNGLYISTWYEGQIGGGRLDAGWASEVYGVIFDACLKRGYFARLDVMTNLASSLSSAARYGRLAEVCESWREGMRLGGYKIETTSYPDLGPALGVLPQVRKRDIPYLAPFSRAEEFGVKAKSRDSRLNTNLMSCMHSQANHLWYQGKWQESLEWLAWIQRWASDPQTGGPVSLEKGFIWHDSLWATASFLDYLGFREQALALHQDALKQKITGGFEGRFIVGHQMDSMSLKRKMGLELPADSPDVARALIERVAGNLYEQREDVLNYKTDLAEILIHMSRVSEGETLLDELAAEGCRKARIARLAHWIKIGRTEGVEAELLVLLRQSRETNRKMEEIVFYRLYADFLERQGRLSEALKIRRELVRLCQSFDLFTHLPLEMAKLAAVLNKLGLWNESLLIADQARGLLGKGGIPAHLAREAKGILDGITRGKPAEEEKDPAIRVDFQPLESVVIPLKGAHWVSHLTLANPSATEQSGMLRATGMPIRFREAEGEVDIFATLGGQDGEQELKVGIGPANYRIIALNAAEGFTGHGKLSLTWTPDQGEGSTESKITLQEAIGGATRAIIQAGAYNQNPFYGIPVYHHYVDTEKAGQSQPMRFVASKSARIEIYGMDGSPIAIDGQGNGSLRDAGDELFGGGDGNGNLQLPLTGGSASFMILIFPQKELPDEGLGLRIECLEGDEWQLYTEDRLMPAPADR